MYCRTCQEDYSELQSLCPSCFQELEPGHATGKKVQTVAWPEIAPVSFDTGALLEMVPDTSYQEAAQHTLDSGIDHAVELVPDASARDLAHQLYDAAAHRVEQEADERGAGDIVREARQRLQQRVDHGAEMVPDESARQMAKRRARKAAEAATRHLPLDNLRDTASEAHDGASRQWREQQQQAFQAQQQIAQAWQDPFKSQQQAFNPWEAAETPGAAENGAAGCARLFVSVFSMMIPGVGQIVYGPRGVGAFVLIFWLAMAGSSSGGLWWFLLGLGSALWTWYGKK